MFVRIFIQISDLCTFASKFGRLAGFSFKLRMFVRIFIQIEDDCQDFHSNSAGLAGFSSKFRSCAGFSFKFSSRGRFFIQIQQVSDVTLQSVGFKRG
jgi:hypothetical protein